MSAKRETFHVGEIGLQERVGARERLHASGLTLENEMNEPVRRIMAMLPWVVLATVDASGRPWVGFRCGPPGFVAANERGWLQIDAPPSLYDPIDGFLVVGARVGALLIDAETRRRVRLNGIVEERSGPSLTVRPQQLFANCPKYIQSRALVYDPAGSPSSAYHELSDELDEKKAAMVSAADTFFIASRTPEFTLDPRTGLDASHRGGKPGFVRVSSPREIAFPDFAGNRFFNTLGNVALDDRIGLVFPDFESRSSLHLSGRCSVDWDPREAARVVGAQRILRVEIEEVLLSVGLLPLASEFRSYSEVLDGTGVWSDP